MHEPHSPGLQPQSDDSGTTPSQERVVELRLAPPEISDEGILLKKELILERVRKYEENPQLWLEEAPNKVPHPFGLVFDRKALLEVANTPGFNLQCFANEWHEWTLALRELEREGLVDALHEGDRTILRLRRAPTAAAEPLQQAASSFCSGDSYVFHKEGDAWNVKFCNEDVRGLKETVGMKYIRTLLSNPNASVHLSELKPAQSDSAPPADRLSAKEWSGVGEGSSDQEMVDDQARQAYRKRLKELDGEIEDAKGSLNEGRQEILEKEKQQILDEVKRSTGKFGSPRKLSHGPAERDAQAVSVAIKRALDHLRRRGLPKVTEHLKASIKREGNSFAYRPGPAPPLWQS